MSSKLDEGQMVEDSVSISTRLEEGNVIAEHGKVSEKTQGAPGFITEGLTWPLGH